MLVSNSHRLQLNMKAQVLCRQQGPWMTHHGVGVHVEVEHAPRGLADARCQPLPHVHDRGRRPICRRCLLRLHSSRSH